MKIEIKHDEAGSKFFANVNGKEAYLRYLFAGKGIMNMIKTYVPPELRGQGIAAEVVHAGLEYAKEKGYSVIPTCSYVETYIERHKEYEKLVSETHP